MKTILPTVVLSLVLFGCCSVNNGKNTATTDPFRAQGTLSAEGNVVRVQAKLTAEQAGMIALSGQQVSIDGVLLGTENGSAVYAVTIKAQDGTQSVVHIDADSGTIQKITH